MKKLLLLSLVLASVFFSYADAWGQARTVTGRVTSPDGIELPGVNVVVRGTTTGTNTNVDGTYSIEVPGPETTLVYSFLGMSTHQELVGDRNVINIRLVTDTRALSEVVVVGYGTQERRDITGSIASADARQIEDRPVPNALEAIQGQVAGVQIQSTSGRPGAGMMVRVRGRASIGGAGANEPLYVIDGVPISNVSDTQIGSTAEPGPSPLANLNPEDIESIQVLKDAAAAAIYGSRASNGVVLITTKRGRINQPTQINFSTYQGVQTLTRRPDMLNAEQYRTIQREARINAGANPDAPTLPDGTNNPNYFPALPAGATSTDWIDEIMRDRSRVSNYTLSASGGGERTTFYVSGSYFNQDAILREGGFERFSTRFNLDHRATDRLNFGLNMQLARSQITQTAVDNSIYSPWSQGLQSRPDERPFTDEGGFAVVTTNNPRRLFEPEYETDIYSSIGNLFAEYEFLPGLTARTMVGTEIAYTKDFTYLPTTSFQGAAVGGEGTAANALRVNWLVENTLSFQRTVLAERLRINAVVGHTYQEDTRERSSVTGRDFPSDAFRYLTSAANIATGFSDWTGWGLESLLGRVNLDLDDRFLISAAIRRDGSSRFGRNNLYGTFPSVAVGWRISAMEFMQPLQFVTDLKLRASYGITGNQASIGDFTALSLIGAGQNYADRSGLGATRIGNPGLLWETTAQTNLGLDASFFNARLNIMLDVYNKETRDLLLARPIPRTSGFGSIQENIGSVRNRGFEVAIQSVNLDGAFRWTTNFNAAYNENEVLALHQDEPIQVGFVSRVAVGQPIGSFFVIRATGVDPQTGNMIYEDLDGSGTIGDADRQFVGNPFPKWEGGLTNRFEFAGFDLSAQIYFRYGNDLYNLQREGINGYTNMGASLANMTTDALRRWQNPGDQTDMPRAITGAPGVQNNRRSSRFVEDGSFARLRLLTLGYTLPANVAGMAALRNARVYVSAQNLFTLTRYSGPDPEVSSSMDDRQAGVDQGAIPQLRTIMIGINLGI
jgi:TonB-dependent starch-binding outer membrane protein SusC